MHFFFRIRDFVHEYVEQLLQANSDDEDPTEEGQQRVPTGQALALANYRMVDHVLRSQILLPTDIDLRLAHAVSLWNLAFDYLPK